MADLNFNADEHEDMSDFTVLPKGWYMCAVTKEEKKTSKTSGNSYLGLEITVMEGQMKGRKLFTNLNLWHPKSDVVSMAQRELATMCRAIGRPKLQQSAELLNVPFGVKVGHRKDKESGEMRENINGYCSEKEFATKSAGTGTTTSGGGATQTTNTAAPWSQQ